MTVSIENVGIDTYGQIWLGPSYTLEPMDGGYIVHYVPDRRDEDTYQIGQVPDVQAAVGVAYEHEANLFFPNSRIGYIVGARRMGHGDILAEDDYTDRYDATVATHDLLAKFGGQDMAIVHAQRDGHQYHYEMVGGGERIEIRMMAYSTSAE